MALWCLHLSNGKVLLPRPVPNTHFPAAAQVASPPSFSSCTPFPPLLDGCPSHCPQSAFSPCPLQPVTPQLPVSPAPQVSRPQPLPTASIPTHCGVTGVGWWLGFGGGSPSGLFHSHKFLKGQGHVFLWRTAPQCHSPSPARGGQTPDYLAVAGGTSQGLPDAGTSHSVLSQDRCSGPFTLHRLTAGLAGTLQGGGGGVIV